MQILLTLTQIFFNIVATCPELSARLDNGNVVYSRPPNSFDPNMGYSETTTATYKCGPGFIITGQSISVCSGQLEEDVLRSVEWSPETPMCQRKTYIVCFSKHAEILICFRILNCRFSNDRLIFWNGNRCTETAF